MSIKADWVVKHWKEAATIVPIDDKLFTLIIDPTLILEDGIVIVAIVFALVSLGADNADVLA